jgi:hypothetical protein
VTPSLSSKSLSDVSVESKRLTTIDNSACTPACTNEGKNEQTDPVNALAAALLSLSPADRARLAALLLGQAEGEGRS